MTTKCTILMDDSGVYKDAREGEICILWNGHQEVRANFFSLSDIVEQNGDQLRSEYLQWIEELSIRIINDKYASAWMLVRKDLNFWWLSDIAVKKSAFASPPEIINTIKLFLVEKILTENGISNVSICGATDFGLKLALQRLCMRLGCPVKVKPFWPRTLVGSRIAYYLIPVFENIKAVVWVFAYLLKRAGYLLTKSGPRKLMAGTDILLVNYFINLGKGAVSGSTFSSSYWGHLTDLLGSKAISQKWLHIYVPTKEFPSIGKAARKLDEYNEFNSTQDHALIDEAISVMLMVRVIRKFISISFSNHFFLNKKAVFRRDKSQLELWSIYKAAWSRSFCGISCVENLLYLELFENLISQDEPIKAGLFLQENQAWEVVFKYVWKKRGNGPLIGVPHSTMRFWDLRYFFGSFHRSEFFPHHIYIPDVIAVNGKVAADCFLADNYSVEQVRPVEALRYEYLLQIVHGSRPSRSGKGVILVFTDYNLAASHRQLTFLAEITNKLDGYSILIKTHPKCPIEIEKYNIKNVVTANKPIVELLNQCDIVYSSNTTSAALEGLMMGAKVICMLDPATLNMSPLRGMAGVRFVSTPGELLEAIISANLQKETMMTTEQFFHLDKGIPKWKHLLAEVAG